MREAFEQWAKESGEFTDWSRDKTSDTNPYHKPRVELAWKAWQAAVAWSWSRSRPRPEFDYANSIVP